VYPLLTGQTLHILLDNHSNSSLDDPCVLFWVLESDVWCTIRWGVAADKETTRPSEWHLLVVVSKGIQSRSRNIASKPLETQTVPCNYLLCPGLIGWRHKGLMAVVRLSVRLFVCLSVAYMTLNGDWKGVRSWKLTQRSAQAGCQCSAWYWLGLTSIQRRSHQGSQLNEYDEETKAAVDGKQTSILYGYGCTCKRNH